MKVTIFQLDTAWLDKDFNLAKIKSEVSRLADIDLFLLPEMFNTGYIMQPNLGAETLDGYTINSLASMLSESNTVIGGSMPLLSNNKYYNTFVFVGKDGLIGHYSKQHLFTPAGEAKQYSSGTDDVNLKIHNALIKPLICYDLRFPYISFNKEDKPYDILLYSANWPKGRIHQWEKLLIARAIENQCFVIGINRVGTDFNGYTYPGRSMVVDYTGEIIAVLNDEEQTVTCTLNLYAMHEYRDQYPFLKDRKMN